MKNLFTEKDITAGLFVIRESSPKGSDNIDFARTVTFKIGFDMTTKETRYGKISCLTDGWYCPIGDMETLVKYLNEDEHGYRPLTKEELTKFITYSPQGFY